MRGQPRRHGGSFRFRLPTQMGSLRASPKLHPEGRPDFARPPSGVQSPQSDAGRFRKTPHIKGRKRHGYSLRHLTPAHAGDVGGGPRDEPSSPRLSPSRSWPRGDARFDARSSRWGGSLAICRASLFPVLCEGPATQVAPFASPGIALAAAVAASCRCLLEITPQRPHCVAGVVRLELRNPLGSKSPRFAGEFLPIWPKRRSRDSSRASCGVTNVQLRQGFRVAFQEAGGPVIRRAPR
jgi:hypothetical protein